ncbi:MAG: pentapeptide repeat-containing protein [Candidatus Hydrogenedentota bacterium]
MITRNAFHKCQLGIVAMALAFALLGCSEQNDVELDEPESELEAEPEEGYQDASQLLQDYAAGERDFAGVDLRDADFQDADLPDADFSRADLTGANFTGANLANANFSNGYLSEADLTNANLEGANLRNVYLTDADLTGANLEDANLEEALDVPSEFLE